MWGRGSGCPPTAPAQDDYYEQRLLKPLPDFGWNAELRDLAQCIQRDILMANPDVKFTDIASLDSCKLLLKEVPTHTAPVEGRRPARRPQYSMVLLANSKRHSVRDQIG